MMSEKSLSRASLVCGVSCVVIAYALTGCGKQAPQQGEPPQKPPVAVVDGKYKAQLLAQVEEREALARTQQIIIRKMEAVAAKYNGDLKAAAADPEMVSLIQRAGDIEKNFASNRAHTAEAIRARATKRVSEKEVNK